MKRSLTPGEAALWRRVAKTVKAMEGREPPPVEEVAPPQARVVAPKIAAKRVAEKSLPPPPRPGEARRPLDNHTLDASWDRKLSRGLVAPDFTLDLHGHTLDSAHARLDHGLTQALAQGARLLLLITGRPRPASDHAARGERRGAIRAKFLDWLAAGSHASRIAAVRPAHPRHGGAGAVYVVLKRVR